MNNKIVPMLDNNDNNFFMMLLMVIVIDINIYMNITIDMTADLKYGILLSGGLDSAVLLYLMLLECKNKQITPYIQPFTIEKSDRSYEFVPKILDYFNDMFGISLPPTIPVGDSILHHTQQTRSAYFDIIESHPEIDVIYMGTNAIPPEPLVGLAPVRVDTSNVENLKVPFFDLYKTHIIEMVYAYNIEPLLNITHSCTEQALTPCNMCWQCNERIWAFRKLGKNDKYDITE
jgi:hypothetical protein